jgi:hypothetical protein
MRLLQLQACRPQLGQHHNSALKFDQMSAATPSHCLQQQPRLHRTPTVIVAGSKLDILYSKICVCCNFKHASRSSGGTITAH